MDRMKSTVVPMDNPQNEPDELKNGVKITSNNEKESVQKKDDVPIDKKSTPSKEKILPKKEGAPSDTKITEKADFKITEKPIPKPKPTGSKPKRWFTLALITLIFINLPFGIAALVYSIKANRSYWDCEEQRAKWEGDCVLTLIKAGFIMTCILYAAAFIGMITLIAMKPCVWQ